MISRRDRSLGRPFPRPVLYREYVNSTVDHGVDDKVRSADNHELAGVLYPSGPAQAWMSRKPANGREDCREDALGRGGIVLSDVFASILEPIERAAAPQNLHVELRFGPRPALGRFRAPGAHPFLHLAVWNPGRAGSGFPQARSDLLNLPGVARDEGRNGLAREVGSAALQVSREHPELRAHRCRQPHRHGGALSHAHILSRADNTVQHTYTQMPKSAIELPHRFPRRHHRLYCVLRDASRERARPRWHSSTTCRAFSSTSARSVY